MAEARLGYCKFPALCLMRLRLPDGEPAPRVGIFAVHYDKADVVAMLVRMVGEFPLGGAGRVYRGPLRMFQRALSCPVWA